MAGGRGGGQEDAPAAGQPRVPLAAHGRHAGGVWPGARVAFQPARIPIVSNVTGRMATDAELGSPAYWVEHAAARCGSSSARALHAAGARRSSSWAAWRADGAGEQRARRGGARAGGVVPALRKDRPEPETFAAALGALHARGHRLDWSGTSAALGGAPVRRCRPMRLSGSGTGWRAARAAAGDVAAAGLSSAEHPLLGASGGGGGSADETCLYGAAVAGHASLARGSRGPWRGARAGHGVCRACARGGAAGRAGRGSTS